MKEPKIVIWDLETLPDPRKIYDVIPSIGAWPGRTFKAELQTIICFGYKIVGQGRAQCINAWDFKEAWEKNPNDDSAVVAAAYEILHDADEIVTHNGKSFDIKVLNTRLLSYGMPPIAKDIKHVDTKISAKKISLYSNSLANVASFLGVEDKMQIKNKWSMWKRMAFKEETAEDRKVMDLYCKQDVDTLYAVYEKLMPFHGNNLVNRNQFTDGRPVCPSCGSPSVIKHGTKRTKTKEYQRYLCTKCGSTCQSTKAGKLS